MVTVLTQNFLFIQNLCQLSPYFSHYFLFSDPKACVRYWTDGYRKEPLAQDFYWEHSDEQIKFIPWFSAPRNASSSNWLRLHRNTDDDLASWGLIDANGEGATPTCYICEIDLPIN